ncbi:MULTISPECIES: nucleotidyltransferase domain-containing protein [unclassified Modestobacter]
MARSVYEGFDTFLGWLTPLDSHRTAATRHRGSVEGSLRRAMEVLSFRQTGSFWHGTGVRHHCDVDLMVSIGGDRPGSSDTALRWVRDALTASFPTTPVYVSRPAVVVDFAGGDERWEVIPGFITGRGGADHLVWDIPAPGGGWIDTAPVAHLDYVNECNQQPGAVGGAKKLARLLKAWKYYNSVPISSFYLEMRAAQHMATQSSFLAPWDLSLILSSLNGHQLAAMRDPKQVAGQFQPCSSSASKTEALSKLSTAATRASKALAAHNKDDADTAFAYLQLLFNGHFPAR